MSSISPQTPARALPARPRLDALKSEAKRRLAQRRPRDPGLKLSAVQFELAREYGFSSWRALKAAFDATPLTGDWIGRLPGGTRLALHVRADGGADMDSPDYGAFGFGVHDLRADDARLGFTLPRINARFDGALNGEALAGQWRQDGRVLDLRFERGVWPPAPRLDGLDGVWEGRLPGGARLILRVATDAHGTLATLDSPDRSGKGFPVRSLACDGDAVSFVMKTARIDGRRDGEAIVASFIRDGAGQPLTLRRRAPGEAPLLPPRRDVSEAELRAFCGRYAFAVDDQPFEIGIGGDGLIAQSLDAPPMPLIAVDADVFVSITGQMRARFRRAPDGTVDGAVLRYNDRELSARRL